MGQYKYNKRHEDDNHSVDSEETTSIQQRKEVKLSLSTFTKTKKRNSPPRKKKKRKEKKEKKHTNNPQAAAQRTSPSGAKHDMPMGKRDLYFALDCEMVGVGQYGAESALARVSIVNWDCEVVLDTFVKVPVPVTDYRTFVSGVRSEDLDSGKAMELKEVRNTVQNILRGKILIGHALENDLKALNIVHPWCDTRDTAHYAPFMKEIVVKENQNNRKLMSPRRLKDLAWEELGKEIQVFGDAHSSIEDAIAALELYKGVRPKWEAHMSEQINKANEIENSRRLRATAFLKRRVQPIPMYHPHSHPAIQSQPKGYLPRVVPVSHMNNNMYIPTQAQGFIPQYKHYMTPHASNFFIPTN